MIDERAKKLGKALVQAGVLSDDQLQKATQKASEESSPTLIISLLELEYLTFKVFEKFLLSTMSIKSAVILDHELNPALVAKVGINLIKSKLIFPISTREDKGSRFLALGMVDPTDERTIAKVENATNWKVVPVLISLPDYTEAIQRNKNIIPHLTEIDLKADVGPFEIQLMGGAEALPEIPSQPRVKLDQETLLGQESRKFREEILALLDLEPAEVSLMTEGTYTRSTLAKHIQKVSEKTLQRIYDRSNDNIKITALINLLITDGLIKKRDMLLSSAVCLAFKADGEKK